MSNEPIEDAVIDETTDDLDLFSDLLNNKVPSKESVPAESDEVKPVSTDEEPKEADAEGEEETPEPEEEVKAKRVNRFQERINDLTAKARQAERDLADYKAAQELKQTAPAKQPTVSVQNDDPDPDAKNEDGSDKYPLGEFDPQYIRDMARNTIEKEMLLRKEQEDRQKSEQLVEEARNSIQANWVEKLAPAVEKYDDFLDKTIQLESAFEGLDPDYSDYLVQTIKSLEHGPEVLYYFANNLAEAESFVKKGPLGATLALGEINSMFKGRSQPETRASKAPPPPQVGTKGANLRRAVSGDTDDLEAFSDVFFVKKK